MHYLLFYVSLKANLDPFWNTGAYKYMPTKRFLLGKKHLATFKFVECLSILVVAFHRLMQ